ncbi:MAG: hypothetical protein AAGD11_14630 [Planctomycetota bacterium]
MQYSTAYYLHCELTLTSGRSITLVELHQRQTYAGLLEGTPSADTNNRDIQHTLARARKQHGWEAQPLLIPPRRTKHLREPGDMDHIPGNAKGYRPTEWMPMVTSSGYFKSITPAKVQSMDGSHLVIVWYQDEFGPPTAEITKQIESAEWDKYAADYEW